MLLLFFTFICLFNYYTAKDKEKSSPFECGLDPLGRPRIKFCIKFFLVGVIFLVFDVEITLLLAMPFGGMLLTLLSILFVGFLYEWYYGGLDWLYVNGCFNRYVGCTVFSKLARCVNYNRDESNIFSPSPWAGVV